MTSITYDSSSQNTQQNKQFAENAATKIIGRHPCTTLQKYSADRRDVKILTGHQKTDQFNLTYGIKVKNKHTKKRLKKFRIAPEIAHIRGKA